MKKSVNNEALEIQRRFFMAVETLIANGTMQGGLKGFCEAHDLNRPKYAKIKTSIGKPVEDMTYKVIDIDALSAICRDYSVRAEWLLLGQGAMFKKGGNQ